MGFADSLAMFNTNSTPEFCGYKLTDLIDKVVICVKTARYILWPIAGRASNRYPVSLTHTY